MNETIGAKRSIRLMTTLWWCLVCLASITVVAVALLVVFCVRRLIDNYYFEKDDEDRSWL